MSIEMDTPANELELADAIANLIEQMFLAHQVRDEQMFSEAHEKAGNFAFQLVEALQDCV